MQQLSCYLYTIIKKNIRQASVDRQMLFFCAGGAYDRDYCSECNIKPYVKRFVDICFTITYNNCKGV